MFLLEGWKVFVPNITVTTDCDTTAPQSKIWTDLMPVNSEITSLMCLLHIMTDGLKCMDISAMAAYLSQAQSSSQSSRSCFNIMCVNSIRSVSTITSNYNQQETRKNPTTCFKFVPEMNCYCGKIASRVLRLPYTTSTDTPIR